MGSSTEVGLPSVTSPPPTRPALPRVQTQMSHSRTQGLGSHVLLDKGRLPSTSSSNDPMSSRDHTGPQVVALPFKTSSS